MECGTGTSQALVMDAGFRSHPDLVRVGLEGRQLSQTPVDSKHGTGGEPWWGRRSLAFRAGQT